MTEPFSSCCLHALVLIHIPTASPKHGSAWQHLPDFQDKAGSEAATKPFPTSSREDSDAHPPWPPRSLRDYQLCMSFPHRPGRTWLLLELLHFDTLEGQMNSDHPNTGFAPALGPQEGEDAVDEAGIQTPLSCPGSSCCSSVPQQGP